MPVYDDESGVYTLGPGGEKQFGHTAEAKINEEVLYRLDANTGVLEICAQPEAVTMIIESVGGLPCKEMVLPAPFGLQSGGYHFFDVREIKSVTNKAGGFFINIYKEQTDPDNQYKSMPAYKGNKTCCDNCNRTFESGEVISVDGSAKLAFCYSDSGGGCGLAYVFSHGVMITGNPMRFGDGHLPGNQRIPNYPNSPVIRNTNAGNTGSNGTKYLLGTSAIVVVLLVVAYFVFR